MFDGVAVSGLFDGGWTSPDFELLHEPIELLEERSSLSLHFGPYPCEVPSSVTVTVLLNPCPSGDVFVASPIWTWTEQETEIAFPSGKASLDDAART